MTQEAPSRFRRPPATTAARWSMGLGLGAVLGLLVNALVPGLDIEWGALNVVPSLLLVAGLAALVVGVAAHRRGERSLVLWLGLGSGSLIALLLIAELLVLE